MASETTPKKEWIGEAGYCNCLLVTMARASIFHIELNSNTPVTNLETLTKNIPDTYKWICAQEFDFNKLSTSEVIKIFADSANISLGLFGRKTGSIDAHDVQKDNGPIIKRIYKFSLSKMRGALILKIDLETK